MLENQSTKYSRTRPGFSERCSCYKVKTLPPLSQLDRNYPEIRINTELPTSQSLTARFPRSAGTAHRSPCVAFPGEYRAAANSADISTLLRSRGDKESRCEILCTSESQKSPFS